ncbi:MAG: hypothetical protein IKG85_08840 [Clostridia bacterium]|nr:hypothetical protein [Clostridia bacterium]
MQKEHGRRPCSFVEFKSSVLHVGLIVVHKVALKEDLLLVGGEALDIEGDIVDAVLRDDLGIDGLYAFLNGLPDAGNEYEVAGLRRSRDKREPRGSARPRHDRRGTSIKQAGVTAPRDI